MDNIFDPLFRGIVGSHENVVLENVKKLIEHHVAPADILQKGMVPAMAEVGDLFEKGEYFIPEMLVSARAMQAGLKISKTPARGRKHKACRQGSNWYCEGGPA